MFHSKTMEHTNLSGQKFGDHVWEWIPRVWDNGGRDVKLDQATFIHMGSRSRDPAFNTASPVCNRSLLELERSLMFDYLDLNVDLHEQSRNAEPALL